MTKHKSQIMQKLLVTVGTSMLIASGIFPFAYDKYWDYRVPAEWSWQAKYLGDAAFPDGTGNFSPKRDIAVNRRVQKVLSWSSDKATILDEFTTTDVNTGKITYQSKLRWEVDPKTGQHLKGWESERGGGLPLLFPKHAEKKDYRLFNYYLVPFTAHFDRVEEISGVTTYVYKFYGELDGTAAYKGTNEYPGVKPEPGQTIVFDNLLLEYWVEPVTGEIVKSKEESGGDYIIDAKTRRRLTPLSSWAANMADDSVYRQVQLVDSRLTLHSYYTVWGPVIAAIAGLIFIGIGLRLKKTTGPTS